MPKDYPFEIRWRARNGTQPAPEINQARCLRWVKLRNTQHEHMFSALLSNSDIARCSRDVSNVPEADLSVGLGPQAPPTYCCSVYSVPRRAPDGHARAGLQIQIRQTVGVGGARSACGHRCSGRSPRIGAKVCATKAPWYSGERGLSGTVIAGNASLAIALESGRSRLG